MSNTENNTETTITGYEFAKEVGKRPQMVYNYMKNQLIKTVVLNGQSRITCAEADRWAAKWAAKSNGETAKVETPEDELVGSES